MCELLHKIKIDLCKFDKIKYITSIAIRIAWIYIIKFTKLIF